MNRLRTALIALVTLAVAAFPLAGASAQGVPAASHESGQKASIQQVPASSASVEEGCDKQAMQGQGMIVKAKADQGKGRCGKFGSCGKCLCFGLTAVLDAAPGTRTTLPRVVKAIRIAESATSLAYIPPSPPPRV